MSSERFRLDLDGVELKDVGGRVVCIVRWRTQAGLLVRLPESTDELVPWRLVEHAGLDLSTGAMVVRFTAQARSELGWLGGRVELVGAWTDRARLEGPPQRPS